MKYLLVGGAGYVGSRLWKRLREAGHRVDVIDLGLLWPRHVPAPCAWADVLRVDPRLALRYDCVVWLATIHDVPKDEEEDWLNVTWRLMVRAPFRWQYHANRFVYFSSMRAATHPGTLYGGRKRTFEKLAEPTTLVIRPGTVWGGYHPDLPNRNHTALNRRIVNPLSTLPIPENHVFMENLLDLTIQKMTSGAAGIVEAVDKNPWKRPSLGVHPMEKYREYYRISSVP